MSPYYGGWLVCGLYRLNLKSARFGSQSLSAPFLFSPASFPGSPAAFFWAAIFHFCGRKSAILRVDYFIITNPFAMKPIFLL
jgi:hypothetical protein